MCSLWSGVLSFELLVLGFGAYLVVLAISVRGVLARAGAESGGGSEEEETKFSMHRNKVELELIFKLQMIWNSNLEEEKCKTDWFYQYAAEQNIEIKSSVFRSKFKLYFIGT